MVDTSHEHDGSDPERPIDRNVTDVKPRPQRAFAPGARIVVATVALPACWTAAILGRSGVHDR
jgi:hypothetical protein